MVIFGNLAYYQRFGFRNAADFGIQTSDGGNMEAFMALELQVGAMDGISRHFHENDVFQVTPQASQVFARHFPHNEKHIRQGQFRGAA